MNTTKNDQSHMDSLPQSGEQATASAVAPTPPPWDTEDTTLAICQLIVSVEDVDCVQIHSAAAPDSAIAYVPTNYQAARQRANAAFIVRACNNHAGLLAALKAFQRGDCWCEMAIGNPMVSQHGRACLAARAAIAKAEGR